MQPLKTLGRKLVPIAVASSLLLATAVPADAATLNTVSVAPSSGAKQATNVQYTITASGVTLTPIRCIKVTFDTLADGSGTKPSGMNLASATFDATSNYVPTPGGWTVTRDDTNGIVTLTNATGETPASASSRTVVLNSITNPTNSGTYYALVNTYNNTDCTTTPVDDASAAFSITDGQTITVTVDPSFSFVVNSQAASTICNGVTSTVGTTATAVNFGRVAAGNFAVGVQQLQVDSNAAGGYVVYARTTAPLTAAGGTIGDFASSTPAAFPATSTAAFGLTSGDANLTTPFGSGNYVGNLSTVASPGTEVAKGPANQTYTADQTCVGYRVNVSGATRAGAYATTLIYTAVPTF